MSIKTASCPSSVSEGKKNFFSPSHLEGQSVKQMEAEAVQDIGVDCWFDKRRDRSDDCDGEDQLRKRGPGVEKFSDELYKTN